MPKVGARLVLTNGNLIHKPLVAYRISSHRSTSMLTIKHFRVFTNLTPPSSHLNICIPSNCFLCLLPGRPSLSTDAHTLQLEETDFEVFLGLKQKLEQVGEAVKFLKAVRRKGVKNAVPNEGGGGGSGDIHLE